MDYNDKRYEDRLKNKIINNTDIKEIEYINYYDSYYIVMDMENIYVFDNKYIELLKIDKILIHENKKKYDMIYKDGMVMYMNDYYKGKLLVYEYYDLYTYELINRVLVGGKYE
jgi:hypothetical protein